MKTKEEKSSRERHNANCARWRKKNREHYNEYQRNWRKVNNELFKKQKRKYNKRDKQANLIYMGFLYLEKKDGE